MSDLLLLSPTPTHPTNAGNRARIRALLEFFVDNDVDFHFAFFRQESGDEEAMKSAWGADRCSFLDFTLPKRQFTFGQRVKNKLRSLAGKPSSIPYSIDDWCSPSLVDAVRQLAKQRTPKCVLLEYVFFSKLFECFDTSTFKVLDTHDVVSNRDKMFLDKGWNPEWFYTTRRQEAIGINRADCVLAIQSTEAEYFAGMTKASVVTVGHIVQLRPPVAPTTSSPTLMFLGSGNLVNQDALKYLLDEIWPRLHKLVPDAVLEICGSICNYADAANEGVALRGSVSSVSAAYDRAWVVVSPLRMGTGLKIKSVESLGFGKALVSAPAGYTGLENNAGEAFLAGDSADEFVQQCARLLSDASTRTRLEHAAYDFAVAWNNQQRTSLLDVLQKAGVITKEKSPR